MVTKSNVWSYEKEYRMVSVTHCREAYTLDTSAVKEIILGCNMPTKTDFEITDIVKDKYPHASVFKCKLSSEKFEVLVEQIM